VILKTLKKTCRSEYVNIKSRGGTIRLVTEIMKDNMDYCTELMNIVDELRHLEGIKGTIGISENDYISATVIGGSQPKVRLIFTLEYSDSLWTETKTD